MGSQTSKHHRLLLVEDDLAIRDAIGDFLEEEGFEVLGASNGEQGLKMLEGMPRPVLVLLDLMMPVMNGFEFLREVQARPWLSDLQVLVMSASRSHAFPKANVVGLIEKPFAMEHLLSAIEQA
jgi:CheY-like chemotaxis protein